MKTKFIRHLILFTLLLASGLTACLAATSGDPAQESGDRVVNTIPPATLTAISLMEAASQTPVPDPVGIPWADLRGLELDFWYIWDLDEPGQGMNAIVDRFNRENEWGITVNPIDQGLVLDPLASVEAAFKNGVVPDLMVSDAEAIASWYQEGLLIDLTPYIEDPSAGLLPEDINAFYSDLYDSFTLTDGRRPGLPFTQSIQVIYYNQSWAEELGYTLPPLGREEFQEQSCSAAGDERKAGVVLSPQAENILSFLYAYQGGIFPEGEDTYQLNSSPMVELAQDIRDLYRKDCGFLIADYPNPMAIEMEFERFNTREALFIMGPALMRDHVHTGANQTGRPDQWTMLPFPGPDGKKAVASRLQSGVIFNTAPEEQLASWLFLKYLVSPEIQAEWARYSGYYPTRKDTVWFLRDFRQENPHWATGLSLLKYGRSVPLHPSWSLVQLALEDAFEGILSDPELDLKEGLEQLQRMAEELRTRTEQE